MLDTNLHRQTMLRVLKDIYSIPLVANSLGFKGGTAAYLLYNLPRFSIDLDFDLLNPTQEDFVFKKWTQILGGYGRLDESTVKHYTLFYLLSYKSDLQRLKLEISRRPESSSFEPKTHLGIPFLVMTKPDMLANKLVALMSRSQLANRDLFDIHFFLKENWPVNFKLVEKRTEMTYQDYIKKCLETVEKVPSDSLLTHMGELVDNKTKYWIKNHLKPELLSLLRIHLDSLTITTSE